MQVVFRESANCFEIFLKPETMEEAAKIVRFGMNRTTNPKSIYVYANSTNFDATIIFGSKRNTGGLIPQKARAVNPTSDRFERRQG